MSDDCILPSLQMVRKPEWNGTNLALTHTLDDVMRTALSNERLLALSLLMSSEAETTLDLAACVQAAHGTMQPRIESGQLYLTPCWRVRHEHMSAQLQHMILQCQATQTQLNKSFFTYYSARNVEHALYSIIGQARSAGAQALLRLGSAPLLSHTQTACRRQ